VCSRLLLRKAAKSEDLEVLTVEEIRALIRELAQPYRTLVFLAAVTGMRVSELLALKWEDVRFDTSEIILSRSIVHQRIGIMKTEASRKPLPLDAGLADVLQNWRRQCAYNQPGDWIFASPDKRGKQPTRRRTFCDDTSGQQRNALESESISGSTRSGIHLLQFLERIVKT